MSYGFDAKPLLNYSDSQERASLVDSEFDSKDSMPRKYKRKSSRKIKRGLKGVRVTKGRISLKVSGYKGFQKLGASELIHYIPLSKLKAAAKKVLKRSGAKKTKKRRKGKRKSRKSKY